MSNKPQNRKRPEFYGILVFAHLFSIKSLNQDPKEIEDSIRAGKCVAVDLPARDDSFRMVLEEKVRSHDSATAFFWFEAAKFTNHIALEEFLFKKYAGNNAIPYGSKSKMEFLAKNCCFKQRVLFIYLDSVKQNWIDNIAKTY